VEEPGLKLREHGTDAATLRGPFDEGGVQPRQRSPMARKSKKNPAGVAQNLKESCASVRAELKGKKKKKKSR